MDGVFKDSFTPARSGRSRVHAFRNIVLQSLIVILVGCFGKESRIDLVMERQLVHQYVGVWNGDSLDILDSILTNSFVRHTSSVNGAANSPDMLRKVIMHMRIDVPDLTIRISDIIISGKEVVFRWSSEGLDSGPGDFPPTYKKFKSEGITWLRLENNRIAEEWSSTDQLDVLLQLGFKISPPDSK